jgi:hypothetical protein
MNPGTLKSASFVSAHNFDYPPAGDAERRETPLGERGIKLASVTHDNRRMKKMGRRKILDG